MGVLDDLGMTIEDLRENLDVGAMHAAGLREGRYRTRLRATPPESERHITPTIKETMLQHALRLRAVAEDVAGKLREEDDEVLHAQAESLLAMAERYVAKARLTDHRRARASRASAAASFGAF